MRGITNMQTYEIKRGYKRYRILTILLMVIMFTTIMVKNSTVKELKRVNKGLTEQLELATNSETNIEGVKVSANRITIDNDFMNLIISQQTDARGFTTMDVMGIPKNKLGFFNKISDDLRYEDEFYYVAFPKLK